MIKRGLVPELLELSLKECGPELVEAALEEFFLWDGVPQDYDQTDEFSQFFVPWYVYEFVDDPHDPDRVANAPHESLAALYLRCHAKRLSATERAFLESAVTSPLCFYSVAQVVPGSEMALRDVLTGSDVVVRERSASAMVQPGDGNYGRKRVLAPGMMVSRRPRSADHLPVLTRSR